MNVFELRKRLITDYGQFVRGFIHIQDGRLRDKIEEEFGAGLLWPEPLIQLNPAFEPGAWIDELVDSDILHAECRKIFRKDKSSSESTEVGKSLRLHKHQTEAIQVARGGHNYVLTTGTGSGKSLVYIIPIVNHVLRHGSGRGIQALVVYPMNALANSQEGELEKFLRHGYPNGQGPVTFARYTGQEKDEQKQQIIANPPDILLTNYVMLELILTRPQEKPLIEAARHLRFLVLDELHTYRGRQGADVAMLVRRTREAFAAAHLQCVGTSATLAGSGPYEEQRTEIVRLHQFISRGDTVYASLESEAERYLTVHKQQCVPGDHRRRILLPLVFCRECGQEYYCVRVSRSTETRQRVFIPRELTDHLSDEEGEAGFLYASFTDPWPLDAEDVMQRLPDDWLEG